MKKVLNWKIDLFVFSVNSAGQLISETSYINIHVIEITIKITEFTTLLITVTYWLSIEEIGNTWRSKKKKKDEKTIKKMLYQCQ